MSTQHDGRSRARSSGSIDSRCVRWSSGGRARRRSRRHGRSGRSHFFPAYLVGFLYWLGISLGCIGLTMLHHLVGGSWGLVIRRPLESGAMNVLPLALLFVPIAFGVQVALSVGAGRIGRPRGGRRTQSCI